MVYIIKLVTGITIIRYISLQEEKRQTYSGETAGNDILATKKMIIDKKKMRPLLWLIVIMISSNKKTNIVIILQHVQQEIELRNQVHTKSNAGEWL